MRRTLKPFNIYDFYQSALGHQVSDALKNSFNLLNIDVFNKRVLEIGYPLFSKSPIEKKAERLISCVIPKFNNVALLLKAKNGGNLLVANDYALPFQNGFFDVVILHLSLEHSVNPDQFLTEVWRIMADSGQVVFLAPSFFNLWRFLKPNPYKDKNLNFFGYLKIKKSFEKNRFTIKKIAYNGAFAKKIMICHAEKTIFSPLLLTTNKSHKATNPKYATAANYSRNFK